MVDDLIVALEGVCDVGDVVNSLNSFLQARLVNLETSLIKI